MEQPFASDRIEAALQYVIVEHIAGCLCLAPLGASRRPIVGIGRAAPSVRAGTWSFSDRVSRCAQLNTAALRRK